MARSSARSLANSRVNVWRTTCDNVKSHSFARCSTAARSARGTRKINTAGSSMIVDLRLDFDFNSHTSPNATISRFPQTAEPRLRQHESLQAPSSRMRRNFLALVDAESFEADACNLFSLPLDPSRSAVASRSCRCSASWYHLLSKQEYSSSCPFTAGAVAGHLLRLSTSITPESVL